jgi:hypothetical protein
VDLPVKCLVLIPSILGAALMLMASQHDKDVASRQAVVVGQIIAHEPSNHNRYGYRFQVGGQEYSGWETPPKAVPKMGQSVTIYYDSRDPSENALTNYPELGGTWLARAWVVLFFGALGSFVIYVVERFARRHNSQ